MRYLGIDLVSTENTELIHFDLTELRQDMEKRAQILKYVRCRLDKESLKIFSKGLILGKLQYILPLLGTEHIQTIDPLIKGWNKALRVITGGLPSTPIPLLHAESGLPPLPVLIEQAVGRYFRRLLQNGTLLTDEYLEWIGHGHSEIPKTP